MPTNKKKRRRAFISYSRLNKDFALKLTTGLRSEGFPVWLDQLDIPTGARWDDEVEQALRDCPIFMVILTPASIASDNVKDEIGYAIDHGKRILPVLLEDCDVPLRLRRFQYVDFTSKSFEEGLASAKELLWNLVDAPSIQIPVKTPVIEAPVESKPASKTEPVEKVETVSTAATQKKAVSRGLVIGIAVVVVLVILGISFRIISSMSSNNPPIDNPATEVSISVTETIDSPTASALDIGSTMTGNDNMTLVYVPAGEFMMGSDHGELNEQPVHPVYLDAFWIDQTEVTNKMYETCVSAEACDPPVNTSSQTRENYYGNAEFDNYPVIYVTWDDANDYCAWAGGRLPTEAEWEKAARRTEEHIYPWGRSIDGTLANYHGTVGDTTVVGKYVNAKSPYGTLDMVGNVAEWVHDWFSEIYYLSHQSSPSPNPSGPDLGTLRVLRGGSWNDSDFIVRSAFRSMEEPANSSNEIGFRCARSP